MSIESCHNINNYDIQDNIYGLKQYFDVFPGKGLAFSTFYKNTHFQVNKSAAKSRSFAKLLFRTILNTKVHASFKVPKKIWQLDASLALTIVPRIIS